MRCISARRAGPWRSVRTLTFSGGRGGRASWARMAVGSASASTYTEQRNRFITTVKPFLGIGSRVARVPEPSRVPS